ncbi:hypothetical protein T484DRAFT_1771432, partial [Baffinella frigidus]
YLRLILTRKLTAPGRMFLMPDSKTLLTAPGRMFLMPDSKTLLTAPGGMFLMPDSKTLVSLMGAGLAVQMRTLAMNAVFILGAKTAASIDATGNTAAAHFITIQVWSLGGTMLLALSTVAAIR